MLGSKLEKLMSDDPGEMDDELVSLYQNGMYLKLILYIILGLVKPDMSDIAIESLYKKIFYGIKFAVLIGILCFFCTFMTVSCGRSEKGLEIKGIDFIFGSEEVSQSIGRAEKSMSEDISFEESEETDDTGDEVEGSSIFNWFMLYAGVCAVCELFARKKIGKYASGAAIGLILFRISAKWYYKIGEKSLSDYEGWITVHFGPALYIAIIIFGIIGACYCYLYHCIHEEEP